MRRFFLFCILALAFANAAYAPSHAQPRYFDTFAGDMYYAVRLHGMIYEDEGHRGSALRGFAPDTANIARFDDLGFSVSSEDGVGLAGGLGIALGFNSRAEFEGSWTQYRASACVRGIREDAADGKSLADPAVARRVCRSSDDDVFGLMLNVYHDFEYLPVRPFGLIPFLGAGVGYAFANNEVQFPLAKDAKEPEWATGDTLPGDIEYKAAADSNSADTILFGRINDDGIRWGIYGGVTLLGVELMYRYWGGEKNTRGHAFSIGYRF